MGQSNSVIDVSRRFSRSGHKGSFRRKNSKNLSAAFNIVDMEPKVDLLNINTTTEEELMTLPQITRNLARNIIEHRKAIGRFKKVEDLALVKGIGAEKLNLIKGEICVGKYNSQSSCSSRTQSVDSLNIRPNGRSYRLINLNKANVFDLQCIHGMTQELAANIVHYRDKKGPFQKLDDLIKVKGFDKVRVSNVRCFLTIDSEIIENHMNNIPVPPKPITNGLCKVPLNQNNNKLPRAYINNVIPDSCIYDIFDLLSMYTSRPVCERFNHERNNKPAIRIATWNLDELSVEKANNLGFKEVVCRTILENGISILGVQDLHNIEALAVICEELNKPKLRRTVEWKDNNKQWDYASMYQGNIYVGFIYNKKIKDINISICHKDIIKVDTDIILCANFKIGDLHLSIWNSQNISSNGVQEILMEANLQKSNLLILGDFSETANESGMTKISSVIPFDKSTTCDNVNMDVTYKFNDNIIINNITKSRMTGCSGIIRDGLTHMAIPMGWNWGGSASMHCPVWVELYTCPDNEL